MLFGSIVTSAKIFTENELGEIVSTQPELIVNDNKVNKAKQKFSKEFKHICLGISASGPTKRWDIKMKDDEILGDPTGKPVLFD